MYPAYLRHSAIGYDEITTPSIIDLPFFAFYRASSSSPASLRAHAMVPPSLLLALTIRSLSLLLPHTFFQPDEFYQAFEPAHHLVFGYGHLTWEWKDLPANEGDDWWSVYIATGRMRGWLWPGVFAGVYKLLAISGLDDTFLLTLAPRLVGVAVAALTDYATSRLAAKLMGHGAASGALFLSLTSLFNAHLLPRALSTSPETLLVTLALLYWPFSEPATPRAVLVGEPPMTTSKSMRDVKKPPERTAGSIEFRDEGVVAYADAGEINYVVMDRMRPHVRAQPRLNSSLVIAVFFASVAICTRPTTLPLWMYLGADHTVRTIRNRGIASAVRVVVTGVVTFCFTLAASTALDYAITGRLMIPTLTFIHQNIVRNISSFYGATDPFYHLVQSLPLMLFPIWYWWGQGFMSCLLPSRPLPRRLADLDRPDGLRTLARALTFTTVALSLSPHSEWRFLHPLLPPMLLFALPPLCRDFTPTILGCYRLTQSIRQYTRISKFPFYLCLFAPLAPWLYLNVAHGRAQVAVMDVLRTGQVGDVTSLVILAPCHSVPWMSRLHKDVAGWFLTCEPPLESNPFEHVTQQALFYSRPVTYIQHVFPNPPVPLHRIPETKSMEQKPSHVVVFGTLLDEVEVIGSEAITVRSALEVQGYHEVWNGWNGFDFAQDESERKGGVRIWRLAGAA